MRQMASIDKEHCIVGPDISSETETTNLPKDWCHSHGSLRGQFFLFAEQNLRDHASQNDGKSEVEHEHLP